MKKYLVIGDYIRSANDYNIHYVGPIQLIQLYGLNPAECVCSDYKRYREDKYRYPNLVELRPRYEGNYRL